LPETTTILMKKADAEPKFVLYDFISGKENELDFDLKNKYTDFAVNEGNTDITFTGKYSDENEIQYSVQATISIDKIKQLYNITNINETGKIESGNGAVSTGSE